MGTARERVATEDLLGRLEEGLVLAELVGGGAQQVDRLGRRLGRDPERLLVGVGHAQHRLVGLELGPGRGLAVELLIDLHDRRQVGEVGVAHDIAARVELAEGEERDGRLVLDQRCDRGVVGRGRGVVEVDLAALEGQVDRAPALEAEDRVDVHVDQVEGQQGGQVQTRRGDAAELQRLRAVDRILDRRDACAAAGVDDTAGAVGQDRLQLGEVVADGRLLEQIGHDRGGGADEHLGAVVGGGGHEVVGARDALATGLVDGREARLAGDGPRQLGADEAGPRVGAPALGERDEHLDGLAGVVAVGGGGGRVEQPAGEQRAGQAECREPADDGERGPVVGRWWLRVLRVGHGQFLGHGASPLTFGAGSGRKTTPSESRR
ncbi:hypothetical protein ACQP1U_13125 [Actinomycetota bacterium]